MTSLAPETGPFFTNSAVRRRVNVWMSRWTFGHAEYTKRCSAHALGNPSEVKTFYDDLTTTGRDLGVSITVMGSYGEAVTQFAMTEKKMVIRDFSAVASNVYTLVAIGARYGPTEPSDSLLSSKGGFSIADHLLHRQQVLVLQEHG